MNKLPRRAATTGRKLSLLMSLSIAALLGGCQLASQHSNHYVLHTGERDAIAIENDWYGDSAASVKYLEQNWSAFDSDWFYFTAQGSKLMPYDLFIHLEQADNKQAFIDPYHLSQYRYLPQAASTTNPDGLPVGFVRDDDDIGFTCSACHTSQINFQGTAVRIDGGPAQSDFVGFLSALEASLNATLNDSAKFNRLVTATLGKKSEAAAQATLRDQLQTSLSFLQSYNNVNHSDVEYGFARVDAIGRIYNQVIRLTSDASNSIKASAPASYPYVWDTSHHDYVQWLGLTANAGAGALGRNLGEVIGVFGHLDVAEQTKPGTALNSSVKAGNIVAMEQWLWRLQSPQWPSDILPAPDADKVAEGKALYEKRCMGCHARIDSRDPARLIKAQMYDIKTIGTDPTEAINATTYIAPAGKLEGATMVGGYTFPTQAPVAQMLTYLVEQLLAANKGATAQAIQDAINWKLGVNPGEKQGRYRKASAENPFAPLQAYKARPLNGIWATAPYLHNGSVPSLFDMLLPPEQRPAKFAVGRLEFDPVKVGYRSDGEVPFVYDTGLPGNSNQGHNMGAGLTDDQRWALVEYLKTL